MGKRYLRLLQAMRINVVGICDVRPDVPNRIAAEFGLTSALACETPEQLFRQRSAELSIVATTAPAHCYLTCMAAESGAKYILCEKPMATSLEECDRMLDTCGRFGARLAINHQMRFMEQYVEPKRICNSEAIGGLASVAVLAGNIGMAMNGTHYIEMFRYLTDEAPEEVSAWFSDGDVRNPRGTEFVDKGGTIRVQSRSGKRLHMDIGADQGHGVLVVYTGRLGRVVVDELAGTMQVTAREKDHRHLPTTRYAMPCTTTTTSIAPADSERSTQRVLEALIQGHNYPTGEDGRRAVSAIVAAYVSNESGNMPVRIDEKLPAKRVFPWA